MGVSVETDRYTFRIDHLVRRDGYIICGEYDIIMAC